MSLKILLADDGSPSALQAVRHVLALVQDGLQAEVVLANVQAPPSLYEIVTAREAEDIGRAAEGAAADLLAPAEALLDAAGVPYEAVSATGEPARTLVDICERHGCALIVLGAHGAGRLRDVVFGSVAEAVLDASPVPVTVVRLPEDAAPEA